MKIKTLGLAISILLAALTIGLLAGSVARVKGSDAVSEAWTNFEQGVARKDLYLRDLYDAVGYGGLIHEFKNYVLRQDAPRIAKARAQAATAMSEHSAMRYQHEDASSSPYLKSTLCHIPVSIATEV